MAAPMEVGSGGEGKEENREICCDDKAQQIFSQYELFHRIFKNLPAKVLNTSCLVCKEWRREIEKIKSSRKKMSWMLYDSAKRKTHDDHSPILHLSTRIQNLPSEPRHVLLFSSLALDERGIVLPASECRISPCKPSRLPRAAKRPKPQETTTSMLQFLRDRLPKSCEIHGVSASGVVGTDGLVGCPMELDRYHVNAGSLLFLSDLPGVDIHTFSADQDLEARKLEQVTETDEDIHKRVIHSLTGLPDSAKVRCVLLFRTEHNTTAPPDLVQLLRQTHSHAVLAGGYVDQFIPEDEDAKYLDDPNAEEPVLKGIAFCGEGIQVASVVLKSSVKNKRDMDDKIKQLRDTGIRVDSHTIGFMFACVGRGHHLHNVYNVEADIFKKHFPRVPLFGMFGNGEIGYDYLPDYTQDHGAQQGDGQEGGVGGEGGVHAGGEREVRNWDFPEMHLSYSSIFVVLSLPGGT